jgi:hypothetical protein
MDKCYLCGGVNGYHGYSHGEPCSRMELPNGSAPSASAEGNSDDSAVLRCGGRDSVRVRTGWDNYVTVSQHAESVPEPTAEQLAIAKLHDDFELKLEFLQWLEEHIDQHSHGWVRNSNGRVIGYQEQWQFNSEQLRQFFQYKQKCR